MAVTRHLDLSGAAVVWSVPVNLRDPETLSLDVVTWKIISDFTVLSFCTFLKGYHLRPSRQQVGLVLLPHGGCTCTPGGFHLWWCMVLGRKVHILSTGQADGWGAEGNGHLSWLLHLSKCKNLLSDILYKPLVLLPCTETVGSMCTVQVCVEYKQRSSVLCELY